MRLMGAPEHVARAPRVDEVPRISTNPHLVWWGNRTTRDGKKYGYSTYEVREVMFWDALSEIGLV